MNKASNFFKSLLLVHLAILGGLSLFAVIAFFLPEQGIVIERESTHRNLQVIAIIFSLATLIIGFNIFKRSLLRIRESNTTGRVKTNQYRISCIIWWVMVEAPGIFAIIGYLLTHNLAFFFLGLVHIVILFVFMPRRDNIILLLNLSNDEVAQLGAE